MTLLPEVEHALLTAIRAPEAARSRRRLLGPAATMAMVAVTLVVCVGALVLLRHHSGSEPSGGAASHQPPSTRQTLLATLGIMRRPEGGPRVNLNTEPVFDANPFAPLTRAKAVRGTTVDHALVRTADAPGTPYVVEFIPVRVPATGSAPASEQLRIAVAFRHPPTGSGRPSPVYMTGLLSVAALRSHGVLVVPWNSGNQGVMIVPDGVATVQVGPDARVRPPPGDPGMARFITLPRMIGPCTADASDNVAPVQLGAVRGRLAKAKSTNLEGVPVRLKTTWFAAGGRVIAQPSVIAVIWATLGPGRR